MAELEACCRSGDEEGFVPPFAVEAVDTISAGDAFHGALAVALAEGRSLPEAVPFAVAACSTMIRQNLGRTQNPPGPTQHLGASIIRL